MVNKPIRFINLCPITPKPSMHYIVVARKGIICKDPTNKRTLRFSSVAIESSQPWGVRQRRLARLLLLGEEGPIPDY